MRHLDLDFSTTTPAFSRFCVDSLGHGVFPANVILTEQLPSGGYTLQRTNESRASYRQTLPSQREVTSWEIEHSGSCIVLRSFYEPGADAAPFLLLIDQKKNHATLLGLPAVGADGRRLRTPCVLHFPDQGTLRISASPSVIPLNYEARRRTPEYFVRIEFPSATAEQPQVEYTLESTLIHPTLPGLDTQPLYDGYRRNFLNLLQVNPRLGTLANNSSSDVCGFCFWMYSELALHTPELAPGLTTFDLVRLSLDRVLDGGLTYGQAGYTGTPEYPEAAPWSPPFDSLDLLPSLLIAGAQYLLAVNDHAWARRRLPELFQLGRQMLLQDHNGNGLIEYRLSGNAGSWSGTNATRPANWWDTIGFAHEDAYSNALAFRACSLLGEAAQRFGHADEASVFTEAARKSKAVYYPTFYNPSTGVLAGWKSADGKLHDYWFVFINGMAIAFGLIEDAQAHAIMDRLMAKFDEVGFTRFDLGLPGNLIPVRKEDYTHLEKRYGGPSLEDGSDGFQIYENGAATHCHTYWTIKALYRLGRVADARRIFHPMLQTFANGGFQGFGENGMSKDWRTWSGECNGYEGYLSDGFLTLLAVEDDLIA